MLKINREQYEDIPKVYGKSRMSDETRRLVELDAGEGLIIFQKDWCLRTKPASLISKFAKENGRIYRTKVLEDGSGWAVLREQ